MRRENIKSAVWLGADQWAALKKLSFTLGRSMLDAVAEVIA